MYKHPAKCIQSTSRQVQDKCEKKRDKQGDKCNEEGDKQGHKWTTSENHLAKSS